MKQEDFVKGTDKYDLFYLYYPKATDGKTTYLVGTTDLSSPYIKERIGSELEAVEDGYARVWSFTSDKLRKIKIDSVLYIRSANKEFDRCLKRRRFKRKTT